MMQLTYCAQNAPLPVFVDGLGGQEDELDDVQSGELEPRPGDISSGASNTVRKEKKEHEITSKDPAPEPGTTDPRPWSEARTPLS